MGILFSIFRRILTRFAIRDVKFSTATQGAIDLKDEVWPQCCTDLRCTSAAKTAKELLTNMEQIQTQLHNEVVLWKLRLVRGICTEESRQQFYFLLEQFSVLSEMLDTVIESERKNFTNTNDKEIQERGEIFTEKKERGNLFDDSKSNETRVIEIAKCGENSSTTANDKALHKRKRFFAKVQDRNVKLLSFVLNEVEECRSIVEVNDKSVSEKSTLTLDDNSALKPTSVSDEPITDQRVRGQAKETIVVLTS